MRVLRPLLDAFSAFANTLQVASYFNWTMAGLMSLAAAIAGYGAQIPWFWVLPSAVIVCAGSLYIIDRVRGHPTVQTAGDTQEAVALPVVEIEENEFRLSEWTNHESYFVWVAACLWMNIKPKLPVNAESPAYPAMQKIKAALETGKIAPLFGGSGATARVSRSELIKFANFYGERPQFLFPIGPLSVDEAELTRARAELAKQERLRHKQEISEGKPLAPSGEQEKVAVEDKQITYIQTATQIINITYNYNITREPLPGDSVDDSFRPRTAAPHAVKGYAAVKFDPNNMELHTSTAVSSITNLGGGQFGVAFISPIDHPQFTTSTPEAHCVDVSPRAATVRVEGHPSLIEVRFIDAALTAPAPTLKATAIQKGYNRGAFERDRGNREAAVLRLAQLRTEGVVIRNQASGVDDANLVEWFGKVDTWMHEVIDVIKCISPADSERFKTLDIVTPARVQAAIRIKNDAMVPVYVKMYNEHDLRLVRLDDLLAKYRANPGPTSQ